MENEHTSSVADKCKAIVHARCRELIAIEGDAGTIATWAYSYDPARIPLIIAICARRVAALRNNGCADTDILALADENLNNALGLWPHGK